MSKVNREFHFFG